MVIKLLSLIVILLNLVNCSKNSTKFQENPSYTVELSFRDNLRDSNSVDTLRLFEYQNEDEVETNMITFFISSMVTVDDTLSFIFRDSLMYSKVFIEDRLEVIKMNRKNSFDKYQIQINNHKLILFNIPSDYKYVTIIIFNKHISIFYEKYYPRL